VILALRKILPTQSAVQEALRTKARFSDSRLSDGEPEIDQHLAHAQGVQARRVGQNKSDAKRQLIKGWEDGPKKERGLCRQTPFEMLES